MLFYNFVVGGHFNQVFNFKRNVKYFMPYESCVYQNKHSNPAKL